MAPQETYSRRDGIITDDYYRAFMRCWRDPSGDVIVKFHKTNIVTVRPNGDVVLFTNKYFTYTTLCSMNDALQWIDMKVSARGDVKDPGNWGVLVVGSSTLPFSDNMVVKARLSGDKNRGNQVLQGLAPLVESVHGSCGEGGQGGGGGPGAAEQGGLRSANVVTATAPPPLAGWPGRWGAAAPPPPAVLAPSTMPSKGGSAWATSGSLAARLAAETKATEAAKKDPVVPGAVWVDETGAKRPAAKKSAVAAAAGAQPAGASSSSSVAASLALASLSISGGGASYYSGGGGAAPQPLGVAVPAVASGPVPAASGAISELMNQQVAVWEETGVDESKLCVVCMHHRRDTLLIPCGHTILCRGCADSVVQLTPGSGGECPFCRAAVDLVLDVA